MTFRLLAEGIDKSYGSVHALKGARLEIRPGEVMALLGENGAGKSTLVKVLSGLVRPDRGTITIDGAAVELSSAHASQTAGVAVVQQEFSTVGQLTLAENLVLGQPNAPGWWSRSRLNAAAVPLLDRVGLGGLNANTPVSQLSVAEMQLVEIARVLARESKIVIFDEPTAALSDAEIARVLEVVRRLAREGVSIIYVTHRLGEVFEIADRVTVFRNGKSLEPMEVSELDVAKVINLIIGRELGDLYPERRSSHGDAVLEVTRFLTPGLRAPVSLTVREGEILGLTGQLGSGCSEFVQALAGVRPVLSGRVSLDGKSLRIRSRRAGIQTGIAYCSADRKQDGIFGGLSILKNLSSPWLGRTKRLGLLSPGKEAERGRRIAAQFAIDHARLASPAGTLSGGNQQKVALGKWIGINPRVLLVEEPTRGVDVGARSEIYRKLRQLCEEGLAIIVSSSDTNEVLGLSDSVATFYRGRLTSVRPHDEWTEQELVQEVMHREEKSHA